MTDSFPLGFVEPHREMLPQPSDETLLLKVMSLGNFEKSLNGNYLHFNRVDKYSDDRFDGDQPPLDRAINAAQGFEKPTSKTMADYVDKARSRTYACCFSIGESRHVWEEYGGPGGQETKVGLSLTFGNLRGLLNRRMDTILRPETKAVGDLAWLKHCSLNYGKVKYRDRNSARLTEDFLVNPIQFAFNKGTDFENEQELRVTLSMFGMGQLVAPDGSSVEPPPSLTCPFDLRDAILDRTIQLRLDCQDALHPLQDMMDKFSVDLTPLLT